MNTNLRSVLVLFFSSLLTIKAFAGNPGDVTQMVNMSLQDLLNTTVTSSAGRAQNLNDVANSIYVITKEDIERSGAREFVDLLYRVPGLQIRQIDGHEYAVSIRGSATYLTNNILVLVDGAVVLNPFLNGTLWENLPVSLNEIERVEIIRGSPGVLYSENAVNGVINIITKSADAKDNYVSQEGGTQSFRDSSIGGGAQNVSPMKLAFRAYLDNQFDQGYPKSQYNPKISDRYLVDRDGGRIDWKPTDNQRLSVIANNSQQDSNSISQATGQPFKAPGETTSAIINYINKVTDLYDLSFHFDYVRQQVSGQTENDITVRTTSFNIQNNFHYDLFGSHITSVGGEFRYNALDAIEDNGYYGLVTPGYGNARQSIISFFAQEEWRPIDKLILTAGVREDQNSFVIHHQPLYSPKVSALYHITDNQSIWASSGETYRTPAFVDRYVSLSGGSGIIGVGGIGSTDLKPESNLTQEVGYRQLLMNQKLKLDASLFSSAVHDVIILDDDTGFATNNGSVYSKGAELTADYMVNNNLSFNTDYSYIYPHIKPETANDNFLLDYDRLASKNVVGWGASYTAGKLKLDLYVKYFEGYAISTVPPPFTKVRGYYKSFMRMSYDFKTPSWAGKLNGSFFVDLNDVLGARKIEDSESSSKLIRFNVFSGIKIKF